jgi:hypothetical protein
MAAGKASTPALGRVALSHEPAPNAERSAQFWITVKDHSCDIAAIPNCPGKERAQSVHDRLDEEHAPMPWNESRFPRSMVNLPPLVRAKAIEIANALLEEGYEEGQAIRIAIAQAKRWAERVVL